MVELSDGGIGPGDRYIGQGERFGGGRSGEARRRSPLIRLLLNTDGVVVGKAVGAGDVFRLRRRPAIPDHQVQNGDRSVEGRKGPQEENRRQAVREWNVPIHG